MQQRQLRLGDILDDYCPRERRVTNHAVVAMVGDEVKQTRCTTCDAEHEFKHARVPRQRRKSDAPAALYSQVLAGAPKRVAHDPGPAGSEGVAALDAESALPDADSMVPAPLDAAAPTADPDPIEDFDELDEMSDPPSDEPEGPVHRRLIRATLPRPEGQTPQARPAPDFTIRQPAGPNRFRRHARGPQPFPGTRSNGNVAGPPRGARHGGRPHQGGNPRPPKRHGPGKRSK